MRLVLMMLFVIWKWTPESFIGVWKLQTGGKATYVNMLPGGGLKLVGVDHSKGFWEKKQNELCFGISNYGNWKLYKGHVHPENHTSVAIQGDVLSGQTDSHYEGQFEIEPAFLQFHTIQYEADKTEPYHAEDEFEGYWLLENNLLTTNYKTEKASGKMRKHVVKRVAHQEESRVIHMVRLNRDRTWHFCDIHMEPVDPQFRGTWGMYNETDAINFNSAIRHTQGRGIWLKANRFEKVYIVTNATALSGICVDSYGLEPVIDGEFLLRKI